MFRKLIALTAVLVLMLATVGCGTTGKGAAVGAGVGAGIGAIIGNQTGSTANGALIGAAIGGAAGAIIGSQMDNAAEEMEQDLEGARIERVGEGIKITFDSGILFDVNKADLQPAAQTNLASLATILAKYEDTDILIEGHTDSDGSDDHNLGLSERRAGSVRTYLSAQGISVPRMTTMGYGETQPVADNATASGKAMNRRVEIAIMANEDLKEAARRQAERG